MKNIVLIAASFFILSCGSKEDVAGEEKAETKEVAVNNQATAMPSNGMKIAYFNMDTVNLEYKYVAAVNDEVMAKEKQFTKNLESLQRQAANWEKKWQEKGIMSSEQEQFQREGMEWQNRLMKAQEEAQLGLQQFQMQKMEALNKRISYLVQEYANEMGYDYILSYQFGGQLYAVNPAYNVTAGVLKALNDDFDKSNSPE